MREISKVVNWYIAIYYIAIYIETMYDFNSVCQICLLAAVVQRSILVAIVVACKQKKIPWKHVVHVQI